MKILGYMVLVAALPACVSVAGFRSEARRSWAGFAPGSVAYRTPPLEQALGIFLAAVILMAMGLLAFDFASRIKSGTN